jgi:Uma2 family endonuclease
MTSTTAKRFTIDEYHRLADLGFFTEDDRVELIRGEIMQMAAKGTPHTNCCRDLLEELAGLLIGRAKLQCQDPIVLPSNSEPEPDFAILRKRADNYRFALPQADDVLLVIEIADSTLKYDQEVKVPLYAEAGIPGY